MFHKERPVFHYLPLSPAVSWLLYREWEHASGRQVHRCCVIELFDAQKFFFQQLELRYPEIQGSVSGIQYQTPTSQMANPACQRDTLQSQKHPFLQVSLNQGFSSLFFKVTFLKHTSNLRQVQLCGGWPTLLLVITLEVGNGAIELSCSSHHHPRFLYSTRLLCAFWRFCTVTNVPQLFTARQRAMCFNLVLVSSSACAMQAQSIQWNNYFGCCVVNF